MRKIIQSTGLFFIIYTIFSNTLIAQDDLPNIFPPSPEAATLGKYMDTPVGVETGVPNISIPLFELEGPGKNIPISLSYHSGGIRVSEIASNVGLGWNLNAGAMVTRTVRGIPDDGTNGYFNPINTVEEFEDLTSPEKLDQIHFFKNEKLDFESDIYSFSFFGQSGKFFFKQTPSGIEVVMNHKKDLNITPVFAGSSYLKGWIITDALGFKYYFGKSKDLSRESVNTTTTSVYSQSGVIPSPYNTMINYVTGWQIMELETPKGESIMFNYSTSSQGTIYMNLGGQETRISGGGSPRATYLQSEDMSKRLDSINSPLGKVEFIYDSNMREDLNGQNAIKEVKLYDFHNKIVDSYTLSFDYFISTQHHSGSTLGNGSFDQRRKRLYLKSIKQTVNNITNKQYTFDYNTNQILPDRLSFAQDFWGFYNGEDNDVFYPSVKWRLDNGILLQLPGAERRVGEDYEQACILKTITYPTGGSTEFLYESNRVFNLPFFGTTDMTKNYIDGLSSVGLPPDFYTKIFTIDIDNYPGGISWFADITSNCANPNGFDCPKARLYQFNGSSYVLIAQTNGQDLEQDVPLLDIAGDPQLKIEILDFSGSFGGGAPNDMIVSVHGYGLPPNTENASYTGGVRIKNIKIKDSEGTIVTEKDYSYMQFINQNKSSGVALNPPTYIHKYIPDCQSPYSTNTYDKLSSNSVYPLTGGGSFSTYYTNITELISGGTGGKTEFEVSFNFDGQVNQSNITEGTVHAIRTPGHDFSHRRGLPLKTTWSAKEGSSFVEKKEINNYYESEGSVNGVYGDNFAVYYGGECYADYIKYTNYSERYYKIKETSKLFLSSDIVENETIFKYDTGYLGRSFPIETISTVSDDVPRIIKTYYPDDVSNIGSLGKDDLTVPERDAILRLKKNDLHRVATPIQVETYKDINNNEVADLNELLNVQRTNYFEPETDIIVAKDVQTLKGIYNSSTNKLQDRIIYHEYYDDGTVKEVSKKDGVHVYYIWGYNHQYPIAKIENFTSSQAVNIQSLIDAAVTASNSDNDNSYGALDNEGSLRAALDAIRNHSSLTNSFITTYTYDLLVGVTSMTDPRGQTIYYQYDDFNRLESIIDDDNKVLSKNEYHYKN